MQECLYFGSCLFFLFLIKCTFLSISRVARKNHVDKVKRKHSPRPHYDHWAKPSTPSGTAQWSTDQSLFVLDSLQEWHCASVISNISKKHTLTISNNSEKTKYQNLKKMYPNLQKPMPLHILNIKGQRSLIVPLQSVFKIQRNIR